MRIIQSVLDGEGDGDGEVPDPDWRDRFSPPSNEVPAPVALSVPLVRTADLSVVASGFEVFSAGITFTLRYRLRTGTDDGVHRIIGGHDPWGVDVAMLGLEYADGRWASTLEDHRYPGSDPSLPTLQHRGASAGQDGAEQDLWLTPLPPAGPLVLVFACAALGVDETSVTVDAGPLVEASGMVEVLWPVQAPTEQEHAPPVPPDLPAGSWFGDRLARRLAEWEASGPHP